MNKLKLQYSIFFAIVVFIFGVIVINEKLTPYFEKKANQKINDYIEEKYSDLNNIKKDKTKKINTKYEKILRNKYNNNYYFKITYKNKKITDTYKKDYVEGYTFLKYISKKIEKDIKEKVKKDYEVIIDTKLNDFNQETQNKIIKEEDLLSSKIYSLKIKINTKEEINSIYDMIIYIDDKLKKENIIPKSYTFNINDSFIIKDIKVDKDLKDNIKKSIKNKESEKLN